MLTDAQKRAMNKYHSKFERIVIHVPKEMKDAYSKHAGEMGESLTAFAKRALDETVDRDSKNKPLQQYLLFTHFLT